ncbi:hypothetical protein N431DRAFT_57405 [Stipitochalara longipes BDJ]|nr:hypothetical protein N431DRAFT_57405 [Stipitochalara longipes BDJ]
MGSTDRNGRPEHPLPRRNTFQRMLDLEKRNKVNRMQASATASFPPARTSTPQGRDSGHNQHQQQQHLELRPSTLKPPGRAMTTPALSLAIPPAKASPNGTTTKYIIKSDGDAVPQDEESEVDSDASSICHSPGWEDAASKKQRKEKREARERKKKEKARAEAGVAKQDQKGTNRLSKAPPTTNKRLSKMAVPMDRSTSEPAVPVVRFSPVVQEMKEEIKKDTVGRTRRGSLEIGMKGFKQVKNAIQVPWKSSNGTMVQTTPTPQETPRTSLSKATGGFIGGLKLRQAEESAVQETIRRVKTTPDDDARGLLDSERDLTKRGPGNSSSSTSIAESYRPVSIYEESIRSPEQWDSIYAQAAILARNNGVLPKEDDDKTPIMERNIKKSRKTQPPTTRYFPLTNNSSSSIRDTSATSTSRTSIRSSQNSGESQGRQETNASSGQSGSPQDISADRSEVTESDRGRISRAYFRHQRRQSEDQAVTMTQDKNKTSETTIRAETEERVNSFQRSRDRLRNSTDNVQSTARPPSGDSAKKSNETKAVQPPRSEKYKAPPLSHRSPTNGSFKHERKRSRSRSAVRGLIDLKNATIAAFSRSPAAPKSPTESFVSATEFQDSTTQRPPMSQRAATTGGIDEGPSNTEHILGENLTSSPVVHDFAVQNPLSQNPPNQVSNNGMPHRQPKIRGHHGRANHSRSTTGSSEDYSAYDESSNITTPTASRPQSDKDYSPTSREPNSRGARVESEDVVQNGFAMMSGGLLDDAASGRESWCRTAMPMELTEDDASMKTPTAKRSAADFTASQPELPKPSRTDPTTNSTGLQREPSLSRSISTPEMQDLSFLPALKHQSLARPPKGKGKGSPGKKGKPASVSKEQRHSPTNLVRPPPVSVSDTVTKSEGSSPTSAHSSQYLQNARLNIPRAPRSPMKSGFAPAHLPLPQTGGPEPIAKMFVICCSCKYFHDMPSKVYECMAKPDNVVRDTNLGVSGVVSTSVKCPWCGHGMSTSCCAGYASVVFLRERLH